jgi:multicomponent Na+:H+ antiporter subunit G
MSLALDIFTVVAVSLGAIFFLAGTVGLLRFPDTLTRLHALTKADNLGLGLVVAGLLPQVAAPLGWIALIAVWLLALLSGATVGQLLASAVRPTDWDRPHGNQATRDLADRESNHD